MFHVRTGNFISPSQIERDPTFCQIIPRSLMSSKFRCHPTTSPVNLRAVSFILHPYSITLKKQGILISK
jgi:hypothetical protein